LTGSRKPPARLSEPLCICPAKLGVISIFRTQRSSASLGLLL
jgi:hypothetical protein